MKELELTLKLRNNRLKRRRLELGLNTREIAKLSGISYGEYLRLENMRRSPLGRRGDWRPSAQRLADFHGVSVDELWPAAVLEVTCPEQKAQLDTRELLAMTSLREHYLEGAVPAPERLLMEREWNSSMDEALNTLTQQERRILECRFGDEFSLDDTATELHLPRQEVRHLGSKALRKLRHPDRANIIRKACPDLPGPGKERRVLDRAHWERVQENIEREQQEQQIRDRERLEAQRRRDERLREKQEQERKQQSDETQGKYYPLGALIAVMTERNVAPGGVNQSRELVWWILKKHADLWYLDVNHPQYPSISENDVRRSREHLLMLYPWLADIVVPDDVRDYGAVMDWLSVMEMRYGAECRVPRHGVKPSWVGERKFGGTR